MPFTFSGLERRSSLSSLAGESARATPAPTSRFNFGGLERAPQPEPLRPSTASSPAASLAAPPVTPLYRPRSTRPARREQARAGLPLQSRRVAPHLQPLATTPGETDTRRGGGRSWLSAVKDWGITGLTSAINVPESIVGMAEVMPPAVIGRWLGEKVTGQKQPTLGESLERNFGFKPKESKEILSSYYSDFTKAEQERFSAAPTVVDKIGVALENPGIIGRAVAESLPMMLAGGVVGRGLAATGRISPMLGGAIGEGAMATGSAAEQIRQETGDLTPAQAGLATVSGAATSALGLMGGRIAQRLGIDDVDTLVAGGLSSPKAAKELSKGILQGAVQEGFLEELPQSVQEQVLQNIATGRKMWDGVPDAAVLGALAGAAMGGGGQVAGAALTRGQAAAEAPAAAPEALSPSAMPGRPVTAPPALEGAPRAVEPQQPPTAVAVQPAAPSPPAQPGPPSQPAPGLSFEGLEKAPLAAVPEIGTVSRPAKETDGKGVRAPEVEPGDVTNDEADELTRVLEEMESLPFTPRTFVEGEFASAGGAGAAVYNDIVGGGPDAPPAFKYTRGQVAAKVREFVETGKRSVVSDLAMDVVRRRLMGDRSVSRPQLPPEAAAYEPPETLMQRAGQPTLFDLSAEQAAPQAKPGLVEEVEPTIPGTEEIVAATSQQPQFEAPFALQAEAAQRGEVQPELGAVEQPAVEEPLDPLEAAVVKQATEGRSWDEVMTAATEATQPTLVGVSGRVRRQETQDRRAAIGRAMMRMANEGRIPQRLDVDAAVSGRPTREDRLVARFAEQAAPLAPAVVEEQGATFETGRPVTFTATRNPEQAPQGAGYQQDLEPAGQFMLVQEGDHVPPGWESRQVEFKQPLVIQFNTGENADGYDANSWKARLSRRYGGKKGAGLARAVRADGYDGIVTVKQLRGRPVTSEIVDLSRPDSLATQKRKALEADARMLDTSRPVDDADRARAAGDYVPPTPVARADPYAEARATRERAQAAYEAERKAERDAIEALPKTKAAPLQLKSPPKGFTRGTVKVNTRSLGQVEVPAFLYGNFAISHDFAERQDDGSYSTPRTWHTTHVPTGFAVGPREIRSAQVAADLVRKLETVGDWGFTGKPDRALFNAAKPFIDAVSQYEARTLDKAGLDKALAADVLGQAGAPVTAPDSPAEVYSPSTMAAAFQLEPEQADAVDVLVKAMGLDTSKIRVARGGDPGRLHQDGPKRPRMSAIHQLSAENLKFAHDMGGFAVPSIAVVPEGSGALRGYGEITLIARSELGRPERQPIFDADAYSPTFPKPEYGTAKSSDANALALKFKPAADAFDDPGLTSEIFDNAVNRSRPDETIRLMRRSEAAKAVYLAEQGIEVKPVRRRSVPEEGFVTQPSFKRFLKEVGWQPHYSYQDTAYVRKLSDAIVAANAEELSQYDADMRDRLTEAFKKHWLDEDGLMFFGRQIPLDRSIKAIGKTEVDHRKTRLRVERALRGRESDFSAWVDRQVLSIHPDPYLTISRKKVPYTLDNIVRKMTAKKTAGSEETMVFGEGKARAAAAKRFTSLESMRKVADQIKDENEISEKRETAKKLIEEWRGTMVDDYYGDPGQHWSTWDGLDDSMRALSRWATGPRTTASLRSALRAAGFRSREIPQHVLELGVEAGTAMMTAPVPYFESKPQRAVGLSEFAGAIIPATSPPQVRAMLERNGVTVATYRQPKTTDDTTARDKALNKLRSKLSKAGEDVLFQAPDYNGPKGSVEFANDGAAMVRAFAGADVSTALHEIVGHVGRRQLLNRSVPAENRAGITDDDITVAEQWAGAKDGTWSVEAEERFARGFERYLRDGKAPNAALKSVFAKFKAWLSDIYQKLSGSDIGVRISPEMRQVFDRMVTRTLPKPAFAASREVGGVFERAEAAARAKLGQADLLFQDAPADIKAFGGRIAALALSEVGASKFTHKTPIAAIYDAYGMKYPDAGSMADFKQRLLKASTAGEIGLLPLDDPRGLDEGTRSRSEIDTGFEKLHFVELQEQRQDDTLFQAAGPQQSIPFEQSKNVLTAIGASKLGRGVSSRAAWDAEMRSEFGEAIDPRLEELWRESHKRMAMVGEVQADDYFNFDRVNISQAEQEALRDAVIESVIVSGQAPKTVETHQQIRDDARDLHPDMLKHLAPFQRAQAPYRAVRMAARQRINALNREIIRDRADLLGMHEEERLLQERELNRKEVDLRGLLGTWAKMRSEDGRNLAMHRMMADSTWEDGRGFDHSYWLSRARRSMGIPTNIDLPLKVHQELNDILSRGDEIAATGEGAVEIQQELADFMKKLERTGFLEAVSLFRKANLLTGIKTHFRNIGGNASFQILEEASRLPASMVDSAMSAFSGKRTVQGVSPRAVASATRDAATKGVADAIAVMKTGASPDELVKAGARREMNTGYKWLDKEVNFVFRTLSAEDKIFKSYAFRRSMEEQAKLKAVNEGVSPIELLANPTEEMIIEATAAAEFATFNNPNIIARNWRRGLAGLETQGAAGKALAFGADITVPYANTPSNLLARLIDYTAPGAAIRATYHAQKMVRQGMTEADQRAFAQAIGRGSVGTAFAFLGWKLAAAGLAVGVGYGGPGEEAVERAANRIQGSIRFGKNDDKWHLVAPFSPTGNLIALGATMFEERQRPLKDEAKRIGKMLGIGTSLVMEQPMLSGLRDTIDALKYTDSRGERLLSSTIGSFVPTAIADISSLFDPYRRDARPSNATDALWKGAASRLPGLRNQLPAREDVLGRKQEQTTRAIWDAMISPVARELDDKVLSELLAHNVGVSWPQRRQEETPEAYRERARVTGKSVEFRVKRLVSSGRYDRLSDMQKRDLLQDAVSAGKRNVSKLRPERVGAYETRLNQLGAGVGGGR